MEALMNYFMEYDRLRCNNENDFFRISHSQRDVLEADNAYSRMSKRGFWYRLWAMIRQKPYQLWDLKKLSPQWVQARYSAGVHLVPLAAIQGSEGKENAFDRGFHPLHGRQSRERWTAVALARQQGQSLPPVELIQVDDGSSPVYFVRDGHHRISVAHAYGQQEIEANVTVWQLHGLAPWREWQPSWQTAVATL
jgi:hypothetical protein